MVKLALTFPEPSWAPKQTTATSTAATSTFTATSTATANATTTTTAATYFPEPYVYVDVYLHFQNTRRGLSLICPSFSFAGHICNSLVPFRQPCRKQFLTFSRPLRAGANGSQTGSFLVTSCTPLWATFKPQNGPQNYFKFWPQTYEHRVHFWIPFFPRF